jgi:hypothetical protein
MDRKVAEAKWGAIIERAAAIRKSRMTQADVVQASCGVLTQGHVSKLERGSLVTLHTLLTYCYVVGVELVIMEERRG